MQETLLQDLYAPVAPVHAHCSALHQAVAGCQSVRYQKAKLNTEDVRVTSNNPPQMRIRRSLDIFVTKLRYQTSLCPVCVLGVRRLDDGSVWTTPVCAVGETSDWTVLLLCAPALRIGKTLDPRLLPSHPLFPLLLQSIADWSGIGSVLLLAARDFQASKHCLQTSKEGLSRGC